MLRKTGQSRLRCKLSSVALGRHLLGEIKMRDCYCHGRHGQRSCSPCQNRDRNRNRNRGGLGFPRTCPFVSSTHNEQGSDRGGGLDIGRYVPPWLLPSLRTSVTTEAARLWPMLRRQEQEPVGTYSISSDELHLDQTKYLVVDGLYCLGHNGHTSSQYFPNRPSPSDSVVPVILPHTADKE